MCVCVCMCVCVFGGGCVSLKQLLCKVQRHHTITARMWQGRRWGGGTRGQAAAKHECGCGVALDAESCLRCTRSPPSKVLGTLSATGGRWIVKHLGEQLNTVGGQ